MSQIRENVPSMTFAEFFAGIGLMRIGLENAGWQIRFANDLDPMKEKIYREHFKDGESHFVLEDIHQLEASDIPTVQLATASFPCTDLSLAGRRNGLSGAQSSAFWGFINVLSNLKDRKPPLVLLENVEGFISSNQGADFRAAMLALNELGYSVDPFIINAARFVPQSRVRLFVVGVLNHAVTHSENDQIGRYDPDELRPKNLSQFIANNPDIRWNIQTLPPLPQTPLKLQDIVEDLPDDAQDWWNRERVDYLLNQTSGRHKKLIDNNLDGDNFSYFTAFRRVRKGKSMAEIRSDGIAGCLRTPKGGSARQILIRAGKGKIDVRLLSPVECARLMGAVDYRISGKINQALFGFGDAVCVPVVTWIAQNYLNPHMADLQSQSV